MSVEKLPEKVKVGICDDPQFFQYRHSKTGALELFGGTATEFLLLLIKGLKAKVEYVVEDCTYGLHFKYPNGTGGGLGRMLEAGKVDFIYGGINMPNKDMLATHPYDFNEIRFCTAFPSTQPKTWVIVEPFNFPVWISIFVAFTMMALVLFWVSRKGHSLADHLFSVIALLLQQESEIMPSIRFLNRFSFAIWVIAAQLLGLFYTSILLSIITAPLKEPPVNTVDKLFKAIEDNRMQATTFRATKYFLNDLMLSNISSNEKLGNYILEKNQYIDHTLHLKHVLDLRYAVLLHKNYLTKFGIEKKVMLSEDVFRTALFAAFVKDDFCCLESLNRVVLHLLEGGIYKKTQEQFSYMNHNFKYIKNKLRDAFEVKKQKVKPITLTDLKGCFVFYGIGMVLAILVFILELIFKKKCVGKARKYPCLKQSTKRRKK